MKRPAACVGSAERPAGHAGTELRAGQRAAHPPAADRAKQLQECCEWLDSLPEQVVSESRPLQRVRSATAALQKKTSSRQREELQPIFVEWGVPQLRRSSGKRKFNEVKMDLLSRVIEETARLKAMHDAATAAMPASLSSPAWATYSALVGAFRKSTAQQRE